jgi:hypothetical protein
MKKTVNDTLVFYHYFEANQQYKDNLIYFLSTACREDLDFIIIITDNCSIQLPTIDNVQYFHTINNNLDYGGYAVAIKENIQIIKNYKYFIFINSSVRGPFLPNYLKYNWSHSFISLLEKNVHLAGTTINIIPEENSLSKKFASKYTYPAPFSHVQTTAYALTQQAIQYLIDIGFYDTNNIVDKDDIVVEYEIRLSQEIKKCGWNIKCFLPEYNLIDYCNSHHDVNLTSHNGDPLNAKAYFGRTLSALEVMFTKTNRNLLSSVELCSLSLSALQGQVSSPLLEPWTERKQLVRRLSIHLAKRIEKEKNLKFKILRKIIKKLKHFMN